MFNYFPKGKVTRIGGVVRFITTGVVVTLVGRECGRCDGLTKLPLESVGLGRLVGLKRLPLASVGLTKLPFGSVGLGKPGLPWWPPGRLCASIT